MKMCGEVRLFAGGTAEVFGDLFGWFLTNFLLLINNSLTRICEQFGELQNLIKTKNIVIGNIYS